MFCTILVSLERRTGTVYWEMLSFIMGDIQFYPPYSLYVFTSVREEGDEEIRMYDMVYT